MTRQSMRGAGLLRFAALFDSLRVSMDHLATTALSPVNMTLLRIPIACSRSITSRLSGRIWSVNGTNPVSVPSTAT